MEKKSRESAERRILTVMFCDLVDSTSLSKNMELEEYWELLENYRGFCCRIIRKYNGYPSQFSGDGILTYFGYPKAREDDPRMAVESGLEIISSIGDLDAKGYKVKIRVGINTGEVVMDRQGAGNQPDREALGDVVNLTDWIQKEAPPNSVVLTNETLQLVTGFFDVKELVAQKNKDLFRKTRLYQVLRSKEISSKLEAAGTLTPLVGRNSEIDLLTNLWQKTQTGTGQLVEIRGEPGIGKSRLIIVLRDQVARQNCFLETRCVPYFQTSPLYPIIKLLELQIGFTRHDELNTKRQKLVKWLNSLKLSDHNAEPLISELLGLPITSTTLAETLPQKRRMMTFNVLLEVLTTRAAQSPQILVVEDLHWADPTTIEFLESLVGLNESIPIFKCLTYRPEFESPWGSRPKRTVVELGGLPPKECETMMRRVAGNKILPDEVVEQVMARAEGFPLFIEEITKSVLESGALREDEDRYELTNAIPTQLIPGTIGELLTARIDRLGDNKQVAHIAATLGREFSYELLVAVSPDSEAEINEGLQKLEETGLVFRFGTPPRAVYTFKHALIRDAAYGSIIKINKHRYHKLIAETLQNQFPEIGDSQPELLATHFEGAGLILEAITYWQRAGDRARERAANREAIKHLEKAIDALNRFPDNQDWKKNEITLQLSLMPAQMAIRGWASREVEKCCTRARELCLELGDNTHLIAALYGLWTFHFLRGDLMTALDTANEVYDLRLTTDSPLSLFLGHHAKSMTHYYRGEYQETEQSAAKALQLLDLDTDAQIVRGFQLSSKMAQHFLLGASLWQMGHHKRGWEELENAAQHVAKINHPPSTAAFLAFRCFFLILPRETNLMLETSLELIRISEEEGFKLWIPVGKMQWGWALGVSGNTEEGLKQMELGLQLFQKVEASLSLVGVKGMYAEVLWKAGKTEAALQAIEEGMHQARTLQEHLLEMELFRLRGEIRLSQGMMESAEHDFERAIKISRTQHAISLELRATISLARLRLAQGQTEEARKELANVYAGFGDKTGSQDLLEAKRLLETLNVPD